MASRGQGGLWGRGELDPGLDAHFRPLCGLLSNEELTQLSIAIVDHVEEIRRALRHNEFLDIETAERLASTLQLLLGEYFLFSENDKKLVAGAARYFVNSLDADPDTGSVLGLDDDTAVLNFVVEAIGRPELKVEI